MRTYAKYVIVSVTATGLFEAEVVVNQSDIRGILEGYTGTQPVSVFAVGLGTDGSPVLTPQALKVETVNRPTIRRSLA